jgi:hypothetical protein
MQNKDNAPFNNQPNRTKRKEDKKKVTFHQENCLPKSASKRARSKNIPKCLQKNRKQKYPQVIPKTTGSKIIPTTA